MRTRSDQRPLRSAGRPDTSETHRYRPDGGCAAVADGLRRGRGPRTADSRPTEIGVRRIAITPPSSGGGFAFGPASSTGRGRQCLANRARYVEFFVVKSAKRRFYARRIPINGHGLGSYRMVRITGRSGLRGLLRGHAFRRCPAVARAPSSKFITRRRASQRFLKWS